MSNLLWGTLALGVGVLLLLIAYNAWEIHRAKIKTLRTTRPAGAASSASSLGSNEPAQAPGAALNASNTQELRDADGRIEPTASVAPSNAMLTEAHFDSSSSQVDIFSEDIPALLTPQKPPGLPPLSELNEHVQGIAVIDFGQKIAGSTIQASLPGSLRAGSKPVEVRGYIDNHGWTPLAGNGHYTRFAAGVLLANRNGPLNEVEYSDFVALVQRVAFSVGGEPDFPDMLDAVARARTLDDFASHHDAVVTIMLRAKEAAWSAAYLQQAAGANGFTAGMVIGRMVHLGPDGNALLSLQFDAQAAMADDPNAQALASAKLILDVPQVPQEHRPLNELRHAAAALALKLDAQVSDEDGKVLTEATWAQLDAQMKGLYAELEAYGVAAGSMAAQKLYS